MGQREFMDLISGTRRGPAAALARGVLRFASLFFWLGARARLALYFLGLLRRHRVEKPVLCLGNLTTGGTGKTPAVAWLARTLQGMGLKPWIVSRGYRAEESGNDEMKVLSELCPGVPHIQDPDRVLAAEKAVLDGADVIVLDDGFSHLRLRRDLDILLFDALNPFGFGRMLPRGLLREPLRSLRRARAAIFTRADVATPDRLRDLEDTIRCLGFVGPVAHAAHAPVALVPLGGEPAPVSGLQGQVVAPFCGIGNPRGFERTLEAHGATLCRMGTLVLDDHARLDAAELERQVEPFLRVSREHGATMAVCTQKDAVKLRAARSLPVLALPVHELRVEFRLVRGEAELLAAIREALGR
ncbi:MAG: tetraacyldisaccharide 4'-kinase [Planctomycetes bacterium]|nr:tetraacyldisaccharide 4'-kinase [Planctomycetota bacterium]